MKTIDVTGLSCPEPVVRTRAALEKMAVGEQLQVLVSTATARENVLRTACSLNCEALVAEADGQFALTITKK